MNTNIENHLVFSYGTLKRGFPNHYVMENIWATYLTDAKTVLKYPLVIAGKWNTPFMIFRKNYPNSYQVTGELYSVNAKGLAVLDEFEGVHRSYYKRLKIGLYDLAESVNPISKTAWCYFRYEKSDDLIADSSKFMDNFGRAEADKYIAKHLRPSGWQNNL